MWGILSVLTIKKRTCSSTSEKTCVFKEMCIFFAKIADNSDSNANKFAFESILWYYIDDTAKGFQIHARVFYCSVRVDNISLQRETLSPL